MSDYFKKHTLVTGTLLLTAAGFLSRILGFFYRIFLSRVIGAEGLGIYQMIFPVYGICLSLCAGSIQTAVSRHTAAHPKQANRALLAGFSISFPLSLLLAAFLIRGADLIAEKILLHPECAGLIPIFGLAIPFSSVHACICGWFYGKEKVRIPAAAQLAEQLIRITAVFFFAGVCQKNNIPVTVHLAAAGLLLGEAGSALLLLLIWLTGFKKADKKAAPSKRPAPVPGKTRTSSLASLQSALLVLALPLMANRLVLNFLQSAEAVLIPARLSVFGLSDSQAVSLYGILTGMAMPFVLFPSAVVNSLAVLLLPSIARHQSSGDLSGIRRNLAVAFRYSLYMGILCVGIFSAFGRRLGTEVFKEPQAGSFIMVLAWLCPFLYLATTAGSVLNGLGKTHVTFLHNLASLLLRLSFIYWGIPRYGIQALLWGMLAGELLLAFLHLRSLSRALSFSPDVWESVVKPVFCLAVSLWTGRLFPERLPFLPEESAFFQTAAHIGIICIVYGLLLLFFHRKRAPYSSNSTVT